MFVGVPLQIARHPKPPGAQVARVHQVAEMRSQVLIQVASVLVDFITIFAIMPCESRQKWTEIEW